MNGYYNYETKHRVLLFDDREEFLLVGHAVGLLREALDTALAQLLASGDPISQDAISTKLRIRLLDDILENIGTLVCVDSETLANHVTLGAI